MCIHIDILDKHHYHNQIKLFQLSLCAAYGSPPLVQYILTYAAGVFEIPNLGLSANCDLIESISIKIVGVNGKNLLILIENLYYKIKLASGLMW